LFNIYDYRIDIDINTRRESSEVQSSNGSFKPTIGWLKMHQNSLISKLNFIKKI